MEYAKAAVYGILGEPPGLADARTIGPQQALDIAGSSPLVLNHALALRSRIERERAITALDAFRRSGGLAFLVSYDEELLTRIADEIWWFEDGKMRQRGAPEDVLRVYRSHCADELRHDADGIAPAINPAMRRGDGRAQIENIELLGESGRATVLWRSGELAVVRVTVKFHAPVPDPVVGMLVRTRVGLNVYGTNTELERLHFGPCTAGEVITLDFGFRCELCPGEYTLTIASHDPDGVWHEWLEDAVAFSVTDSRYTAGVANLRATVALTSKRT